MNVVKGNSQTWVSMDAWALTWCFHAISKFFESMTVLNQTASSVPTCISYLLPMNVAPEVPFGQCNIC